MTDLEAIAKSVAKALRLLTYPRSGGWYTNNPIHCFLHADGSNVFSEEWQVRCRDWLFERGKVDWSKHGGHFFPDYGKNWKPPITLTCCPAEFCAKAIHELMQKDK